MYFSCSGFQIVGSRLCHWFAWGFSMEEGRILFDFIVSSYWFYCHVFKHSDYIKKWLHETKDTAQDRTMDSKGATGDPWGPRSICHCSSCLLSFYCKPWTQVWCSVRSAWCWRPLSWTTATFFAWLDQHFLAWTKVYNSNTIASFSVFQLLHF